MTWPEKRSKEENRKERSVYVARGGLSHPVRLASQADTPRSRALRPSLTQRSSNLSRSLPRKTRTGSSTTAHGDGRSDRPLSDHSRKRWGGGHVLALISSSIVVRAFSGLCIDQVLLVADFVRSQSVPTGDCRCCRAFSVRFSLHPHPLCGQRFKPADDVSFIDRLGFEQVQHSGWLAGDSE
jgi:hypothetical protein